MAETYRVLIDLEQLGKNLADTECRPIGYADVVRFLADTGFRPAPASDNRWFACTDLSLGILEENEIAGVEPAPDLTPFTATVPRPPKHHHPHAPLR